MESLAVHYRPTNFSDVVSQSSTIKILKKQIQNKDFSNCYLFSGASGCGKTTVARIFANEINNHRGKPIEIDAASNNGVDNVRNMINSAKERSLDSEYKIYIIDECHALTSQSWQAFLKCIEEPPKYTIFIFCTTDPQKIPDTIKNRVMQFNFTRISDEKIKERLMYICKQESFINYEDACSYISRICNGGMRDAIALLDKCSGYSTDLSIENVLDAIGDFSYDVFFELLNSTIDGDEKKALSIIDTVYSNGSNIKLFIEQYFAFVMDVNKFLIFGDVGMTKIPTTKVRDLAFVTGFDNSRQYYNYYLNKLFDAKDSVKSETNVKVVFEFYLMQLCRCI